MTFATVINLVLAILCVVVVIQSLRMMKAVKELQSASLEKGVGQLEAATAHAQAVLTELKSVLGTAMTAQNRTLVDGEALRDELSVMVGIGNAVAERIVDAAAAQKSGQAHSGEQPSQAKADQAPKAKAAPASHAANDTATAGARSADRRGRSRSGGHRRASNKMVDAPVKAPTTNTVGQA